jgi:tRNA-specific 2-thiouridylase
MADKLAVAMSGGVDSSVAAWLLREQGYDLTGVTLRLHGCAGMEDASDARAVAEQLGFGHHVFDLSDQFRTCVMDHFVSEYERGRTPNPCVECNRRVKFGALLDKALELGADAIATGHYARIEAQNGRYLLRKALHPEKDQSYVLWGLNQFQLGHTVLPLGGLSKEEIRAAAAGHGLVSAHKSDSQDICFVPDGDYAAFIRRHTNRDYPCGEFLSPCGKVLGQHEGIVNYTLGQRRGLGVSSNQGRLYVTDIDPQANTVVLGPNEDLFSTTLVADSINLIPFDSIPSPMRLKAKVRYRMPEQPCTVEQTGPDTIRVTFDQPQRAITPGQSVVLYQGDLVVGGGTISEVLKK